MCFQLIKKLWKNRENQYIIIGYFFLIMQVLIILSNYYTGRMHVMFWFCSHTPLIFGLAFLLDKKDVIKGLINVGFLFQFAWTLDFLSKLIFNVYIFWVTDYLFNEPHGLYMLVPILVHILGANLALFMTYKEKPNLRALFYSLIYLVIIYWVSLAYTIPERNVNCVHLLCGIPQYTFPYYTNLWLLTALVLIVLPTHGIQYLLYRISQKHSHKNQHD
jgi:hypothetical protein